MGLPSGAGDETLPFMGKTMQWFQSMKGRQLMPGSTLKKHERVSSLAFEKVFDWRGQTPPFNGMGWLLCFSLLMLHMGLLVGCGLIPAKVDVDVDYPFLVLGGLSSAQPEPLPGVGSQVRQTLANEGVPVDKIEEVRLTTLDLVHLDPICEAYLGCDLGFIDGLEIFVESPGLARQRLGWIESPGDRRNAPMTIDEVDLTQYVRAQAMTLVAEIDLGARPIRDVYMEIRATIRVDAKI